MEQPKRIILNIFHDQTTALMGTLLPLDHEWVLKVGDITYKIHVGPREYRIYKGFYLKEVKRLLLMGMYVNTM